MSNLKFVVTLFAVLILAGCVGQAYKQFSADWPSYQEVSQKSPLGRGKGRLFVYYPLKDARDIFEPSAAITGSLVGVAATSGFGTVDVVVDRKVYAQVVDGSFGYIDLAPGTHQVLLASAGKKYELSVSIGRSKTTYVEFNQDSSNKTPPTVVASARGKTMISSLHNLGDNVDGIDSPQCYRGSFSKRAPCAIPKRLLR
ncbi:MAG: hypothetical protein ABJQ34_18230 [Paracoccaceae bacterium]